MSLRAFGTAAWGAASKPPRPPHHRPVLRAQASAALHGADVFVRDRVFLLYSVGAPRMSWRNHARALALSYRLPARACGAPAALCMMQSRLRLTRHGRRAAAPQRCWRRRRCLCAR